MEPATVFIIDNQNSEGRDEDNALLIWAGCLFCEKVSAASWVAAQMYSPVHFDHLNEKQKFKLFYDTMCSLESAEGIRNMKKAFDNVQIAKKMHGKSKQQLIELRKLEKTLEMFYSRFKEIYLAPLNVLKLTPLLPLTNSDIENKTEKPLSARELPESNSPANTKWIADLFSNLMVYPERLPLLEAENISPHADFLELSLLPFSLLPNQKLVLCDRLFEFPEPLSLTAQQVQVIRNDLSAAAWKLMEEFTTLNRELQKIAFTENNFLLIAALYTEKSTVLKEAVQQSVDQNQYLNRVKTETEDKKTWRLWMGITSFHTLFEFYRLQGVIDLSAEAYSKEETARTAELANSKAFLFLEVIDNI